MAFVRIKRRRDENPAEALLLATKRLKTTESDEKASIFEFTATLDCNEEAVISYLDKARKLDSIKSNFKKRSKPNITEDFIKEHVAATKNNRLEVINCFRALEDNKNEKPVTVVDVVAKNPQDTENENYVYDIYQQTGSDDGDDMLMDRMCSVYAIDFDTGENDDDDGSEEYFDCSDDSNAEDNWRNDYPDEESDQSDLSSARDNNDEHSINEEDMINAMNNLDVYELSSDDDEYDKESNSDYADSTSDYSDLSPGEYDDPDGCDKY